MQQQRLIAPLLPVAISLMVGIVIGRYISLEAPITLTILFVLTVAMLCVFRFPRLQTILILLTTVVIGCHLIQHPLPDVPRVKQAKQRMVEYRQQLLEQYQKDLSPEAYSIVAAMTLGDRTSLSSETRQAFNITGAGHILAISGLHLGIIYMVISFLVRGRRWRVAAQILTILLLWTFAFLVGMMASVVRAATMLTIYGLLSLGYRRGMSINVLAFTAILMLVAQPDALFEISFQMSYLAVFAILLIFPMLYHIIPAHWLMEHRFIGWMWGMTLLSLSAQIGVAPLIAFYFHRFSVYFLLANFVVIPCAYLILIGGLLLLLTSWSLIAKELILVVNGMQTALSAIATLPYASIEGLYPSLLQTILIYILIASIFIQINLVFRSIYTNFARLNRQ